MIRGLLGVRTTNAGNATPGLEIFAVGQRGFYLRKMEISLVAGTATAIGLGRPAAVGITPTTPVTVQNSSAGDQGEMKTQTALAWATPPTIPTAFLKRVSLPATVGAYQLWEFVSLFIPSGGSIVIWNFAVNSVLDVSIMLDEQYGSF